MNSLRCLIALPLVAIAVSAQTTSPLPDRPAAAISNYKDTWLPVVGTDNNAAVVVPAGGSPVTLGLNAGIVLSVGDHFADGFVTVKDAFTVDVPTSNDLQTAATTSQMKPTSVTLQATLTSDVDIPDAYALLITYPPTKTADAAPMLAVVPHTIGDLKAGVTKHISAVLPKLNEDEGPGWSILVFDAGRQVRSSTMGEILPGFFDRIETASLKKRIAERVDKRVDAPLAPFRQLPLGLPDAVKAKYHGTTLKVEIRVSVDGRLVSAKPVGVADPALWEALNKGFSNWLFLPPVKDGTLVPASAIIPVKL